MMANMRNRDRNVTQMTKRESAALTILCAMLKARVRDTEDNETTEDGRDAINKQMAIQLAVRWADCLFDGLEKGE